MRRLILLVLVLLSARGFSCFAESPRQARPDVPISAARPEYSFEARQRQLSGAGVFALHVRANGTVASVHTIKSTGQAILDQATITAFRKWRFVPGRRRVITKPIHYTTTGVTY